MSTQTASNLDYQENNMATGARILSISSRPLHRPPRSKLSLPSSRQLPRSPQSELARLKILSDKDGEIAVAKAEAERLVQELERIREAYEEERLREMLEHSTEIDEMERQHFFEVGRREYEQGCALSAELQSRRDAHAAHLLKLQQEIEMNQQSTSELQERFQRIAGHQVGRKHFDNAIHGVRPPLYYLVSLLLTYQVLKLVALFRDQQILVINKFNAKLKELAARNQTSPASAMQQNN
ncbi:hypothetical protein V5O48_009791 [Marasmius crinis-equi]|uniref:Uncharacterized protein n=1 Tax=Marasmius crinis-equi TaxID=585013 RepID=A0ABR3FA95_9AGAR